MILLIDDREKAPLFATGPPPGFAGIARARLVTGDYSIQGHEDRIAIERKMPSEVYYTCGRGRARFRRALERMREMVRRGGLALIVVEGSRAAIGAAGRRRAARGYRAKNGKAMMACSGVARGRACGRPGVRLSWGVCSFVLCAWHRAEFRRTMQWRRGNERLSRP